MAARRSRTKVTTGAGIQEVHDAGTPESAKDNHGLAAFRQKLARGGKVIEGKVPRPRLDRRANGGNVKGKGKMTVNVIVAGGGPGAAGGGPMPPMMPPPMGAPPPMPPPRPPMAPPPPGAMPPPGAVQPPPMMPRAKGGRVAYPLKDGSGGGEGRLEKLRAYGRKALEGAKTNA